MDRPKLGQQIKASAIVRGEHVIMPRGHSQAGRRYRKWVCYYEELEGIYIGFRTVQEGRIVKEYHDAPTGDYYHIFIPENYLEVWLIVVDPRQNPLHVLPGDVTDRAS